MPAQSAIPAWVSLRNVEGFAAVSMPRPHANGGSRKRVVPTALLHFPFSSVHSVQSVSHTVSARPSGIRRCCPQLRHPTINNLRKRNERNERTLTDELVRKTTCSKALLSEIPVRAPCGFDNKGPYGRSSTSRAYLDQLRAFLMCITSRLTFPGRSAASNSSARSHGRTCPCPLHRGLSPARHIV
jgi:hypothetical protein